MLYLGTLESIYSFFCLFTKGLKWWFNRHVFAMINCFPTWLYQLMLLAAFMSTVACHVHKRLFAGVLSNLWFLQSVCPSSVTFLESWGKGVGSGCPIWAWAHHNHLFFALWSFVGLCVNLRPLQKEASLMGWVWRKVFRRQLNTISVQQNDSSRLSSRVYDLSTYGFLARFAIMCFLLLNML